LLKLYSVSCDACQWLTLAAQGMNGYWQSL